MNSLDTARLCAETMLARDSATRALGITIEIPAPGSAIATMQVVESMINGHGTCHGGYIFTLADSAFAFACNAYDRVAVAAGASIDFLRAARAGDRLVAEAAERHRGRTTGFYEVSVTNQDNQLVALFHGRSHATGEALLP